MSKFVFQLNNYIASKNYFFHLIVHLYVFVFRYSVLNFEIILFFYFLRNACTKSKNDFNNTVDTRKPIISINQLSMGKKKRYGRIITKRPHTYRIFKYIPSRINYDTT